MKPMLISFACTVVIAFAASYLLAYAGFSTQNVATGANVRVTDK